MKVMKNIFLKTFVLACIAMGAIPSHADKANTEFAFLAKAAKAGFTGFTDAESIVKNATMLSSADACRLSLQLSGEQQLICHWKFDYRVKQASEHFANVNRSLSHNVSKNAEPKKDKEVNHPDFYDLRTYENSGATFSVSLKDKAALAQTYVFLRISKTQSP